MPSPAPPLAPIFRSNTQLQVLTQLFVYGVAASITELSDRTGLSVPLISREVNRLTDTGLVTIERRGPLKLVAANTDHPSAAPLRQLLDQSAGAIHHLRQLLTEHEWCSVERAVIFGSWARRFQGEPGASPNDLDVVLVSEATLSMHDIVRFQRELADRVGLPVDAFAVTLEEWRSPTDDSALASILAAPFVEVPITAVDRAEAR